MCVCVCNNTLLLDLEVSVEAGVGEDYHCDVLSGWQSSQACPPDDEDVGVELDLSRGGAVIFGSNTYHRSGVNGSGGLRRVYYAQFSPAPITSPQSSQPLCFALKCV